MDLNIFNTRDLNNDFERLRVEQRLDVTSATTFSDDLSPRNLIWVLQHLTSECPFYEPNIAVNYSSILNTYTN